MNKTDVIQALKDLDWSGVSIGHKCIIQAAINELEDNNLRDVNSQDQGVKEFANKPGFSYQHGSIYAHFGNGDVMVGCVTHDDGSVGINFAPVRQKLGGPGTNYDWTIGKTAQEVESVFVIASTSVESLYVIRNKLEDAIKTLREKTV